MDETDLYRRALEAWGASDQVHMMIEECAELVTALAHWRRGRVDRIAVAEEVADVEVMCGQLRVLLGDDLVSKAKQRKLERLKDRIEHWESGARRRDKAPTQRPEVAGGTEG